MAKIRLNDDERRQWVLNDEGLYNWYRGSRKALRSFIRDNRAAIDSVILKALNAEPLR